MRTVYACLNRNGCGWEWYRCCIPAGVIQWWNDDSGMMRMASAVYQLVVLQTVSKQWGCGSVLGKAWVWAMGYRAWAEGVNMGDGVHHPAVAHTLHLWLAVYQPVLFNMCWSSTGFLLRTPPRLMLNAVYQPVVFLLWTCLFVFYFRPCETICKITNPSMSP